MNDACALRVKIHDVQGGIDCFVAAMGRSPATWAELATRPECGVVRTPTDPSGQPLRLTVDERGSALVSDERGAQGGNWFSCHFGPWGTIALLIAAFGIVLASTGLFRRRRRIAIVGVLIAIVGVIAMFYLPVD